MKYYKTIFTVTVLSGYEPDACSLETVAHEIDVGDWSGCVKKGESQELTAKEMVEALQEQGSDPSFLGLDEDGNEIE